ncbi:MAG: hypothetical protein JXB50_12400, partial [Spirochaetes bacterium]|nr:hypothetical protein [Spirochaetota bacterium]
INKLLYNMSCSNDKEIIDFRTMYYGKNYSNTKKNGTTTHDIYGKNTIYDYYFKISKAMELY